MLGIDVRTRSARREARYCLCRVPQEKEAQRSLDVAIKNSLGEQRPTEERAGDDGVAVLFIQVSTHSLLLLSKGEVNLHSSLTNESLESSTPIGASSARLSGNALVGSVKLHAASPLAHGLDDGELAGALDGSAGGGLGGGAEGGAGEDGGDHFYLFL